jgi:tetratricopeptide (TPR) repeat protein/tRNA A-37 threonylcarbamoyl transferase component Bud32
MDPDRWKQIQKIFHDSADLPASEQASFVERACGGDEVLRADVVDMLKADSSGTSLLDHDVAHLAGRMLEGANGPGLREFGAYKLLRVLGEGGMGVVHLARRKDLGSFVAIKILRDASMSPARRERFTREQRTLAKLTHPSIARLYDADALPDGTPWFAMEYVEGSPLTEYCSCHASSFEQKLILLRAVCEAVQYAHSLAVIHRDLKPSNILVQSDGTVKLLDFGIAKQLDTQDMQTDQTRTALRLMTPAYAAPEQIRGEPIGVYTDVYALGVILYELLTDRLPFELSHRFPGEMPAALADESPERPSLAAKNRGKDAGSASWADLDVLCLTALQKTPEKRYRSAEAFLRDIDHYLAGEPLEARPDTIGYRIGKFVRRNQRAVTVYGLIIACLAGLIVFYTGRLATARNAALAEAARTQRLLRFTLNLFSGGDNEAGPASDLRVTTLIDRGIAEAGTLEREPEVQSELYETLGQAYQKLGELDRADSLLNLALDRRKALFGADSPLVAESQVKLGLLRIDQARFDDAEHLVRGGLEVVKRKLPAGHPDVAAATHTLGKVLEERGSYDEAIKVLSEAVRLRSAPNADRADLARSLLELANTHFYAGRYSESEALNRRLLQMHREIYGDRHPLVGEDLINLGAIQQELAHYKEAEEFDRRALEITEAFYGKDHYKTASNLTLIARALVKQNRSDEAEALLQRALAIQERVFGKVHPRVASAVNELGSVALARDRFDDAEIAFRRMLDIYKSVYKGKHYLIGIAEANLGSVSAARNDYIHAEPLYREALAMYAETLPPDHLNVAITRIKLGRTLLHENRFKEAEAETLAGYQILSKQAKPSATWLQQARKDLLAIYRELHEAAKAERILAEQAAVVPTPDTKR